MKKKLDAYQEVHGNTKKKYTFKKYAPVIIDKTAFDFKGVKFNYEHLRGRFDKTQHKYNDIAIYINKKDLKKVLDDYHYEYLFDCTNGAIWINDIHNLEIDSYDEDLFESLMHSIG